MPLRCLLFSSDEEMVQPIWQVLTDLGIEGEYCRSAVDAVERVTTQLFQIVITDWGDQPEAAFLLKTARDLKAAQRPLTLAIVSDDARLPEALKAGANSVLVKPIRAEQVRDTMSTACELLRAKQQPAAPHPAAPAVQPEATGIVALAAAAAAGAVSTPASVKQAPERTFRAGEFLQSPSSALKAQFDTKRDVQQSLDQATAVEADALTELDPAAAGVKDAAAQAAKPQEALTGWASLQARLTRATPQTANDASAKSVLLSYGEMSSDGASPAGSSAGSPAGSPAEEGKDPAKDEPRQDAESEAALFAYLSEGPKERAQPTQEPRSKRGRTLLMAALAVACAVLLAMPRARQSLRMLYRNAAREGGTWLNPSPAPLPQAVAQHDSFGQSGDEYKLPTPGNIPDATTDPSQIRVLPVIDPTAKPEKVSEANGGQAPATTGGDNPGDQSQTGQSQTGQSQTGQSQTGQSQTGQSQTGQSQTGQSQTGQSQTGQSQTGQSQTGQSQTAQTPTGEGQAKDSTTTKVADVPGNAAGASPGANASAAQLQPNAPVAQAATPQLSPVTPVRSSVPRPTVSAGGNSGIPSSLKSQMASMTPESSGAKPVEAAMSSIEPVNLPESVARELLAQPVDPEYPAAARASGQRGSVVLQVLIGRDGAVQEAKFLQGSLVFARAAIDAVKRWRFKPYSLNGRAVSVQSVLTLNFKP